MMTAQKCLAILATSLAATIATGVRTLQAQQPAAQAESASPVSDADVLSLRDWQVRDVYEQGWSARALRDADVIDATGEDVGDVETIVVDADGRIVSLLMEVGGVLGMGQTMINVPWEEVEVGPGLESVRIPVTEEAMERYEDFTRAMLTARVAGEEITPVEDEGWFADDVATGPRAWRVEELIGDYAYLTEGAPYGYVRDIVFDENAEIAAVVISAGAAWGYGTYAYPYAGWGYRGWTPYGARYPVPYTEEEVRGAEPFETRELRGGG